MNPLAVVLAAAVAILPTTARANSSEDILGVSARTSALGGAGTALVSDFTATYYNPAGLALCREGMLGVDVRHVYYRLQATRDPESTAERPDNPSNYTRLTAGLCIRLPYNLSFGTMLGLGVRELLTETLSSQNTSPRFPLYGHSTEQMTILLGLAWRPKPWLAVGFGVSIFLDGSIPFNLRAPIAVADPDDPTRLEPLDLDLDLHMVPKVAPYLGVIVEPRPHVRLGVAYRDPLFSEFEVRPTVAVKLVGLDLLIPVLVEAIGWYSPRQFALGASGEPIEHVTVTGDVTWYNYGALASTPYPFLSVTPTSGDDGITSQIGFPRVENPGWNNAWAVRAGGELRVLDDHVAVRAGYALRTAALNIPDPSSNVNLLDGTVQSFTFGVGYSARGPADRSRNAKGATFAVDTFFRANAMADQRAEAKLLSFGGTILDLGVTATMGW